MARTSRDAAIAPPPGRKKAEEEVANTSSAQVQSAELYATAAAQHPLTRLSICAMSISASAVVTIYASKRAHGTIKKIMMEFDASVSRTKKQKNEASCLCKEGAGDEVWSGR